MLLDVRAEYIIGECATYVKNNAAAYQRRITWSQAEQARGAVLLPSMSYHANAPVTTYFGRAETWQARLQ